jgi:hypothetical protein
MGEAIDTAGRWGDTANQWADAAAHVFRWLLLMAFVSGIIALCIAAIVKTFLEG